VSAGPPPAGPPSCRVPARTARALQALLDDAVARNGGYGGGVLRIDSDGCGLLWEGASGERAHGDGAMRTSDTFEIASVTKAFTAAVALQLAEEGALDLDAPVPADLVPSRKVTLRQLLAHRSGLPDYWTDPPFVAEGENAFLHAFLADRDRLWKPDELLLYARALTPAGPAGGGYHYADTNYVVIGLLVERVTGRPLEAAIRARILEPLEMSDTYVSYREPARAGRVESTRYEERLALRGERRQSADWAGGGLVSSARDLHRFTKALAAGRLFKARATLDAMKAWAPTGEKDVDYGLGLFRLRLDGGGEVWGHDGHGNAFAFEWPERGLSFVGTLNQLDNDWWPLVQAAMKALGAPSSAPPR
jgi:D-alanyl-D-alanine carboxypeptidase